MGIGKHAQGMKLRKTFRWMLSRPKNTWEPRTNSASAHPAKRVLGKELIVTFVNHATVLIQTEGLNILTDPIWSMRTSPASWLGPKRYREPGIPFGQLPPIDIILISHNHYDHMDLATLRKIREHGTPTIISGLGNSEYLSRHGIQGAIDLDWWQSIEINSAVTIRSVPAQHFSSRALSDRDKTLWTGFVIETPHGDTYFAGDTGYGLFAGAIKERYDEFRLGLIPIGAYIPSFIMSQVHLSPKEAYRFAGELHVKTFIPIHFGTFRLADDTQDQPVQDLTEVMIKEENGVSTVILENGQMANVEA